VPLPVYAHRCKGSGGVCEVEAGYVDGPCLMSARPSRLPRQPIINDTPRQRPPPMKSPGMKQRPVPASGM